MLGNSNAKRTRNKKPVWQEGNDYYTWRWRWSHDGNCLKNCRVSFIGLNFKSWTSLEITSHTVLLFFLLVSFMALNLDPKRKTKRRNASSWLTCAPTSKKKKKRQTSQKEEMAAGEIKLWGVVPRASERWKALTPIQRRKWIVIKKQYNRQTGSGQKERGKRYFQILS